MDQLFTAFSGEISKRSPLYASVVDGEGREVFISGEEPAQRKMYLNHFFSKYRPFDVIVEVPPETEIPFEEWMAKRVAGKPFALFVCRNYTCGQPSYSLKESIKAESGV